MASASSSERLQQETPAGAEGALYFGQLGTVEGPLSTSATTYPADVKRIWPTLNFAAEVDQPVPGLLRLGQAPP